MADSTTMGTLAIKSNDVWVELPDFILLDDLLVKLEALRHDNWSFITDDETGIITGFLYGLERLCFVPVPPHPNGQDEMKSRLSREKNRELDGADKLEEFLAERPVLRVAVINNELTVRQVAMISKCSVATAGRVIKKMRGG